jgi:hypothetical protein
MGVLALTSVAVPLAIAWGILGIWLGRVQRQQAHHPTETPRAGDLANLAPRAAS